MAGARKGQERGESGAREAIEREEERASFSLPSKLPRFARGTRSFLQAPTTQVRVWSQINQPFQLFIDKALNDEIKKYQNLDFRISISKYQRREAHSQF